MNITNEQLSAYLDGALTPTERAKVDRALTDSPKLRQELADLKQLGTLLKSVPAPTPPAGFTHRVLEKTKPQPRAWLHWTLPLLGAATAALVMIYVAHDSKTSFRSAVSERGSFLSKDLALPTLANGGKESASETRKYADRQVQAKGPILLTQHDSQTQTINSKNELGRSDQLATKTVSSLAPQRETLKIASSEIATGGHEEKLKYEDKGKMAFAESAGPRLQSDNTKSRRADALELESSIKQEVASTSQEWQGDSSGIEEHREIVIKDAASWTKLWEEHQSNMGFPAPVPAVNFKESMVVGIFLGERGSSGYIVQLTETKVTKDEVVISYIETSPASGMMQLTVMTQPHHLKIIPRTNLPVRFTKQTAR